MNTIEQTLALKLNEQYQRMYAISGTKEFNFSITAHVSNYGDGNMTVTYSIGNYGDSDKCQGSTIETVCNEYMRRKNWSEANKPMTLLNAPTVDPVEAPQPVVTDVEVQQY